MLIVPTDRARLIAAWRKGQMRQDLDEKGKTMPLRWLDRFEMALIDGSPELSERRVDLHRFRSIELRENLANTVGPSVDLIIVDLSCLRGVGH